MSSPPSETYPLSTFHEESPETEPLRRGASREEPIYRPVQRPRPRSVLWGCAALGAVLGLLFVGVIGLILMQAWAIVIDPHVPMYADKGLPGLPPSASKIGAVLPLIGRDTLFDIAISVWAKHPRSANASEPLTDLLWHLLDEDDRALINTPKWPALLSWLGPLEVGEVDEIWSGIVKRNVTLQEKHNDFELDLDIPRPSLFPQGVYAVVTLIPHLGEWRTDLAEVRHYKDGVAEVPLLGSCLGVNDTSLDTPSDARPTDNQLQAALLRSLSTKISLVRQASKTNTTVFLARKAQAVLANKTQPVGAAAFASALEEASDVCKVPGLAGTRHRLACKKAYRALGHWSARYTFRPAGGVIGGLYRYAPYVGVPPRGPLDWEYVNASDTQGTLRHHLSVRLSVVPQRTIAGFEWAEVSGVNGELDLSEHWRARNHDRWENMHGVLGSGEARRRGWARVAAQAVSWAASIATTVLTLLYWYTRTTVTGLSVPGTLSLVAGNFVHEVADFIGQPPADVVAWLIFAVFAAGYWAVESWLQLRTVLPLTWDGGLKRVHPSHRERLSARRDISTVQVLALVVPLFVVGQFCNSRDLRIIPSSHPRAWKIPFWSISTMHMLDEALRRAARIAQMIMNARSRSFAGSYALTAIVWWFFYADDVLRLFLKSEYYHGLDVTKALDIAIATAAVVQAMRYPRVEQYVPDEED